ncbi:MAG: TonB-dependent receptor [Candidatus Cloacimonetes bacterium]|nr:TonB-dependent receptor [Candidatus Cloacimonadota bacterium]
MKNIILLLFILSVATILQSATLSGFVSNAENGEHLPYINVIIEGTNMGTYTNKEGYFVINNIPNGNLKIVFFNIGFEKKTVTRKVENKLDDVFLKVELKRASIEMEGITVSEERHKIEINTRDIIVGSIIQTTQDILDTPQVMESDVFRAIQFLPGVSAISDFSSGLYVRGGSHDQNLILLDEIDVYNPTHFGGIFSTFNTDAVENITLLKGGFPAKYGGRLSSVLDITNLDGNRKHHQGIARFSLLASSATLQGPWHLNDEKGSYMTSFRRTNLELISGLIPMPDYYFYDGHAKVNWDITEKDKFTTSFYFGKDRLKFDFGSKLILQWGNETFSTQWVHIFNPKLFSHFVFAGSHYGINMEIASDAGEKMEHDNNVYDLTFKGMFTYFPNEVHLIEMGWEAKVNKIDMIFKMENTSVDQSSFPDVKVDSGIYALFLQDSWKLSENWTMQPGLRFSYAHANCLTLPASPTGDYFRISPRFSLRYSLGEYSNTYVNVGRYYQYLTSMNMGTSTPFDMWFPIDGSVLPGQSDHYIWGIKKQFSDLFAVEWEWYYKDYKNLVEYRPETDWEWDNETGKLADAYNCGVGFSYGSDVLIRTTFAGLEGFVGYGFCLTKRKINNMNVNPETEQEEWFFPRYDRTHQVNILETYNLSKQTGLTIFKGDIKFNVNYSFASGQPYLIPEQLYYDEERYQILYSYRDNIRLANYSRTDFSLKFKWQFKKWSLEPYIQIINMFEHKNIWSVDYIPEVDEYGSTYIEEHKTSMFPRIPFVGFNIDW